MTKANTNQKHDFCGFAFSVRSNYRKLKLNSIFGAISCDFEFLAEAR